MAAAQALARLACCTRYDHHTPAPKQLTAAIKVGSGQPAPKTTHPSALTTAGPQGGFYTTLDRFGAPQLGGPAGDKGLVATARQLYTFATLALKSPGDGRVRELAKRAYDFLVGSALWDAGEGLFRWQVTRDGKGVVFPQKVLYGQGFAILGLARYARAVGDAGALDRAVQVFEKVDATRHDNTHGGYMEDVEATYPPGVGIGSDPRAAKVGRGAGGCGGPPAVAAFNGASMALHLVETWESLCWPGAVAGNADATACAYDADAKDARMLLVMAHGIAQMLDHASCAKLCGSDAAAVQSHNTHLHLVEAFTELSRALEGAVAGAGNQSAAGAGATPANNSSSAGGADASGGGASKQQQAAVNARLAELVALLPAKLWKPATSSGADGGNGGGGAGGHIGTEFYSDWTVVDPSAKLYAHEIELVYFLLAAVEQLGRAGVPVPAAAGPEFVLRVGQAAMEGYDAKKGGFWTEGDAGRCLNEKEGDTRRREGAGTGGLAWHVFPVAY
jgi:hypothetical protein